MQYAIHSGRACPDCVISCRSQIVSVFDGVSAVVVCCGSAGDLPLGTGLSVMFGYPNRQGLDFFRATCHTIGILKKQPMQATYRIIGYGHANYGFFNQFNFASTYMSAMNDYQNLIADPEMDGAVLIEVNHEDWRVVEEFDSGYAVSVVYGPLGNFKVEKTPNYVFA